MTTDLWTLNKICQKHNISIDKIKFLFECIAEGALDPSVLNENKLTLTPKLLNLLDDLVEAGFISSNPDKEWKK